jgi:DNA modification methylase
MTNIRTRRRPVSETFSPSEKVAFHEHIMDMKVECLPIDDLVEPPRKFREHSKRHIAALKGSILQFDITKPILVNQDKVIVAGHGVWKAAKELGRETIAVLFLNHLTPEQIRLYRLADNQIGTMSTFNDELLCLELGELSDLSLEFNFDLEVTGFSSAQIDQILLSSSLGENSGPIEADEEVDLPTDPPISREGDLWILGNHRLYCGNSLEEASYLALMAGELAQMVVADSPYNVPVRKNVSSRKQAREFAFASGEMSSEEFIDFERAIFRHCVQNSIDGSIHYQFIDWRHVYEMLAAGREEYNELKNILVWNKTNASRGFYRSQHELICVFKNGTADHICTFVIEEGARYRTNVLTYPGCNTFRSGRDEDLAAHPTVKNLSLIADLLRDCSERNGIILDPFGGSGTTLLAAELTGRRARLIEIDPQYVDVTVRRWEKRTGREAVLEATGQTFAEVAEERAIEASDEEGPIGG